jgi:hypothetical protein
MFAEARLPMKRRILTVGTTFFLAAATGHVMQNGVTFGGKGIGAGGAATPAVQTSAVAPAILAKSAAAEPVRDLSALPDFPTAPVTTLSSGELLAARMDVVSDGYERPETDADEQYSVFGIPCGASDLALSVGTRGILTARLSAPCHPSERVIFSHAGLSFAMLTDAAGRAEVAIPAMMREGRVEAAFADASMLGAERIVPHLDTLRRFAISGGGGVHLNVYENGAAFGEAGHYSATKPGDLAVEHGAGVVTLGDPEADHPIIAEVYTASAGATSVGIEAEAEVTAESCGRAVKAHVISMASGQIVMRETLNQSMPACDAIGDLVIAPLPGWDGPMTVATAAE